MIEKSRILVVDDEIDQVEILKDWLDADYFVDTFTSSMAALKAMEAESYSLLITDFSMPELNGAQLAAKITKFSKNRGIPVIMLTGLQDDLALSVIKSIPKIHFVEKPIRRTDFLPIVAEVLKVMH